MAQQQKSAIKDITGHDVKTLKLDKNFGDYIPNFNNGAFKKDPFILWVDESSTTVTLIIGHRMTSNKIITINKKGEII